MLSCSLKTQRRSPLLLVVLLVGLLGVGCQSQEPPSSYVARVGSHYLTSDDLDEMLADMGPAPDSSVARQQVIDQWVTRMLLYREAERLNLQSTDAVQRQLRRQRQSTLIAALKERLYEDVDLSPSPQEVRTYFERHKKQLRLREPYVQVRYLSTSQRSDAERVRQTLRTLSPQTDSTWLRLVRRHAVDSTQAYRFSRRYLPENRLVEALPFRAEELKALDEGDTPPILQEEDQYHVLRLDRRVPSGTEPKLRWIEPEIRRRLRIRARKQMYTSEVQRLRNEAQANNVLEVP